MIRILANDGIHPAGQLLLEEAGYEVHTEKVAQENLAKALTKYDVICVRSATKVRKDLIDACPNLKIIARGGVGVDARHALRTVLGGRVAAARRAAPLGPRALVDAHGHEAELGRQARQQPLQRAPVVRGLSSIPR